jgi:general secretion pathway protein I
LRRRLDHRRIKSGSAGFTLFEVVIALAIAALGLGFLVAAAGTGLENGALADQYMEATRRAQSHLAALDVLTPLRPGDQSGDDGGGYSWRVRVSQPALHAGTTADQKAPALYTVDVSITWRAGNATRTVSLQSQRIGQAGGTGG